MNIVFSNLRDNIIFSVSLNVFKKVVGVYTIQEISSMVSNLLYKLIIIDITAIKNYNDINVLNDLKNYFNLDKVILLLDGTDISKSNDYTSKLLSFDIYNYCNTQSEMISLINNPKSYKDISKTLTGISEIASTREISINAKVICFKNLTEHAGSTSLIYMLKKQLEPKYSVCALEVNKSDFIYFNSKNMYSTVEANFADTLCKLDKNYKIILIDLNNYNINNCGDIIYLLESSTLKLNKMVARYPDIFKNVKNKYIILNKNVLSSKDINTLESELKIKFFYTLPQLNDRINNIEISNFIASLGFK